MKLDGENLYRNYSIMYLKGLTKREDICLRI